MARARSSAAVKTSSKNASSLHSRFFNRIPPPSVLIHLQFKLLPGIARFTGQFQNPAYPAPYGGSPADKGTFAFHPARCSMAHNIHYLAALGKLCRWPRGKSRAQCFPKHGMFQDLGRQSQFAFPQGKPHDPPPSFGQRMPRTPLLPQMFGQPQVAPRRAVITGLTWRKGIG